MLTGETLDVRFASQPNSLNALRLVLAAGVIVWHSYALLGHNWLPVEIERLAADLSVDAFFAISGFLICRAWQRNPDPRRYLTARLLRILPGLWVCLFVTAFVIAPLAAASSAEEPPPTAAGQFAYVLGNASTWVGAWGIDGGPITVPHSGVWNGSLWSLGYEMIAYLGVLVLGVTGLLRARVLAGVALASWVLGLSLTVSHWALLGHSLWLLPRTWLMFSCGALLWLYRDRVPVSSRVAGLCAAAIALGALTPNYRLIAAPAVAYLCIWLSLKVRWALSTDISYGLYVYGFPVQQALILAGVTSMLGLAAATLTLAALGASASWFLVERPFLRSRRGGVTSAPNVSAHTFPAPHQ